MKDSAAQGGAHHHPFAGMLWMALASALFAAMNVFARVASARLPWAEVGAARTTVAALVALGVAFVRRAPLTIRDKPKAWARSLCGTVAMLCVFYTIGASEIALGDVVTLSSMAPVFIALLAPYLLGESSGRWVWLATLLAAAGVTLVVGPELRAAGHLALIAVLGAFFSALAMIFLRKMRVGAGAAPTPAPTPMPQSAIGTALGEGGAEAVKAQPGESPEAIVVHFSVVSSAVMIALAIPTWRTPNLADAGLLAATGLTGGLAQLAMTRAYALERAARLGTIGYLGVILTHFFGIAVLHERTGTAQVLGSALVVGSGVLIALLTMLDARKAERQAAAICG
jgi:drug/metabolite transporter (DMT)-like permease